MLVGYCVRNLIQIELSRRGIFLRSDSRSLQILTPRCGLSGFTV
jgi:hypothetical protein